MIWYVLIIINCSDVTIAAANHLQQCHNSKVQFWKVVLVQDKSFLSRSQSTIWLTSHWPSIPVLKQSLDSLTPLQMTIAPFIVVSGFSWILEKPLSCALHCTKSLFGALMCTAPLEDRPIQNLKVESAAMIRSMIHPGPGTRTGQFRDFKKREKWSGFKLRSPSAAIARTPCFDPPSPSVVETDYSNTGTRTAQFSLNREIQKWGKPSGPKLVIKLLTKTREMGVQ